MKFAVTEVYQSALKLMLPLTLEHTFVTICSEAERLVNGYQGSMFLVQNGELQRVYSNVPTTEQFQPRVNGFTIEALKTQIPVIITRRVLKKFHPEIAKSDTRCIVFVPLVYEKKAFGVLTLRSRRTRDFGKGKLRILQLFGSLASLKLRNNLLFTQLNQALDARDLFISMASHELKTPLTTLAMYAELIDKTIEKQQPISRKWTAALTNATKRLANLVEGLLEITTIQTGKILSQPVMTSLNDLIDQAALDFHSVYSSRQLKIDRQFVSTAEVFVDPFRILQVLNNILNNAAKYSMKNTTVEMAVTVRDAQLIVTITDHGTGIKPEHLTHVFERYYRGEMLKEGLGIGLFVTKKIVDEHQGTITITSDLGKGTVVTISLPQPV